MRILRVLAAASVVAALALTACGSAEDQAPGSDSTTLAVGSQAYYSNEIIAEIYAQALEAKGYEISREFRIGQREAYLPELESGSVDIMPEYTGNLLQYLDPQSTATTAEEIQTALGQALPTTLTALTPAQATDQDSYTVTRTTAEQYQLTSIADLTRLPAPVAVAGNYELETRPYGIPGLKSVYGVDAKLSPVDDSGSTLTVKALVDGQVQVANIYTASPAIKANDLVTLEDPQSMILPQQVMPIVSSKVDEKARETLNEISAQLSTTELVNLNDRSVNQQLSPGVIAGDWLRSKGLA